jgi:hypothetical protein
MERPGPAYSRSFMMRASRLPGSTMAFRETPFITLSLVSVLMLAALTGGK